jgi:tetratricopeptide (TPR) repeat protein
MPNRRMRARLLSEMRRDEEAIAEAQALLAEDPEDWIAHAVLAYMIKKGERHRLFSPQHLEAVERLAPETADAYYLRGSLASDPWKGVELLTRAIELDPGHSLALLNRANLFVGLRNYEAALDDADRLTAARPRSVQGRRRTALIYYSMGDFERALVEYDKTVDLNPRDPRTYLQRAWVFQELNRWEDAVADYTRAIEMGHDYYTWAGRAGAHRHQGRYEAAIADARTAIERNPDELWGYRHLADTYFDMERPDEVRALMEELRRVLRLWGDHLAAAIALSHVAAITMRLGDYQQALVDADRAIELAPDQYRGYVIRVRALQHTGDQAAVREACEDLAALDENKPWNLYARAKALGDDCDRWSLAVAVATKAIELAPEWNDAYWARGEARIRTKQYEEALDDLSRCVELAPWRETCHRRRGYVNTLLGRVDNAANDADDVDSTVPSP